MRLMKAKETYYFLLLLTAAVFPLSAYSQSATAAKADFEIVVRNRLLKESGTTLEKVCPVDTDATAQRIFREYGAMFVSVGTKLPTQCVLTNDSEVKNFQAQSDSQTTTLNGVNITLQKSAMNALLAANADALKIHRRITPRSGSNSAARSFETTVKLWNSRFYPALNYWVRKNKITKAAAEAAKNSGIREQIAQVLKWEAEGYFFSRDLSKSILYSVAAPGASQHNFMLALDVQQFSDPRVRDILAAHGWFQTVKSDLPHFTFLGVKEADLPALGLQPTIIGTQKFWIPDF